MKIKSKLITNVDFRKAAQTKTDSKHFAVTKPNHQKRFWYIKIYHLYGWWISFWMQFMILIFPMIFPLMVLINSHLTRWVPLLWFDTGIFIYYYSYNIVSKQHMIYNTLRNISYGTIIRQIIPYDIDSWYDTVWI